MLETIHAQADDMSAEISAMPPWKRELLERKRRQEEEDRKRRAEELERLSHMPPWKRELMMKKKKSTIYMSRSASANEVDGRSSDDFSVVNGSVSLVDGCVVAVISEEARPSQRSAASTNSDFEVSLSGDELLDNGEMQEEHLLPIECNPWLKLDPNSRRRGRKKAKDVETTSDSSCLSEGSGQGSCVSPTQNSHLEASSRLSEQEAMSDKAEDNDSVFDEEEVTYGKGFVHKLLKKFKHMSAREDSHTMPARKPSPKRTHSSENILEDRNSLKSMRNSLSVGDMSGGYSSLSKRKAQSMDCLMSRTEPEQETAAVSHDTSSISGYHKETSPDSASVNKTGVEQSAKIQGSCPGELVRRSVSQENDLEDLPRTNIVSVARSVFESISSSQKTSGTRRQHSPERFAVRTSATSNVSSSHNMADAHVRHSVSSADQPISAGDSSTLPPTGSLSVARHTQVKDSTDKHSTTLKASNNQKVPGSRLFCAGKKSESPTESSVMKSSSSAKANEPANRGLSHADEVRGIASTQPSPAVMEASTAHSYNSSLSHASASTNASISEDHCPAPHVPKAQEHFDQNSRDQSQHLVGSDPDEPAKVTPGQEFSREAPALSEEITVVLNQSAKDVQDSDASSTGRIKRDGKSVPVAATTNDSAPSLLEHRNAEANRLNLNLNLNELSRKKTITDENTDINRNSKPLTNEDDDGFPVPLLRKKKLKKAAPSGPGSLLIRPASNLVAAGVKTEYLCLNKYHDIKEGEFAPAKKRPSHYYDEYGDDDVPVTDMDDYLPITNIDDVSPVGTPREGDPTQQKRPIHTYEFVGAGVKLDRSLLSKTKHKKMKLNFNDAATSTFEYPSEQSLLDIMPPEPGDFDFHDPNSPSPTINGSTDEPPDYVEPTGLRPAPGLGSAGTLGSYQSKCQVDYFFGMEQDETKSVKKRQQAEPVTKDIQPAADEDFTWSDAASSDMLF